MNTDPSGLFLDTNILVYAFDAKAGNKHALAKRWIAGFWRNPCQPHLSVQVLQEFHVTLVRKGCAIKQSAALVDDFLAWPVVANTPLLVRSALAIQQRFNISYWDSSIIAAARGSGCERLWSEDLNPGQNHGGVTVVNPFVES